MTRYFATFISGTSEIIHRRLKQFATAELRIRSVQDGLVLFDSTLGDHKLAHLRFFTNLYVLLADLGKQPSLQVAAHRITGINPLATNGTFRIVAFDASQPVALDTTARAAVIECIESNTPLRFDATQADNDIVLLRRADGQTFLGLRLAKPSFKMHPKMGALSLELAHILCLVAGVGAKDTVLDPFAGFGSIPLEAVRDFNVKKAIAVEKNPELAAELKIKSLARLEVMTGDATQLSLADNSISRVVTDPPWGKFEQLSEKELSDLYEKSLAEMVRVVKPNGVITILSAVQLQSYTHTLPLELVKEYNILVSGQKATIYKFRVNK